MCGRKRQALMLTTQVTIYIFFNKQQYPEVGLLDHMVILFFIFEESQYCFPQWLHQFAFPPAVQKFPFSPHPHQHLLPFVFVYHSDGVQDTLPQHMLPWHIQYFKLKEFEKWHGQEGFSDLPLKQAIKSSCDRCPPILREAASLSSKIKGHREESE